MSYNIRFNTVADGVNAWPNRKERVAALIRRLQPDTVGLQEALKRQLDDLNRLLPDYGVFGLGREGTDLGEHSAILYRKERLELLEQRTLWLAETPDQIGCRGWDSDCPRILTWGRFKDRTSGGEFYHFNTHFDHMGVLARKESAALLNDEICTLASSCPAVVTGDFNMLDDSDAYAVITSELQDTFHSAAEREGPEGTFTGFRVGNEVGIRIDYVFVNPFMTVQHYHAHALHDGEHYPSDHLPIVVKVRLEEPA